MRDFVPNSWLDCGASSVLLSLNRLAISARINADAVAGPISIISAGNSGWYLRIYSTKINILESQTADIASSTTALSNGTTYQVGVSIDSGGNGTFYLDGVADGTFTTSATLSDSLTGLLTIGVDNYSSGGGSKAEFFDGRLGELGVWDQSSSALTAADWAALGSGYTPPCVRPDLLRGYWQLLGRISPEIEIVNRYEGTINGTVNQADHVRIFQKRRTRTVMVPDAAVGGSAFPWHYYQQMRA